MRFEYFLAHELGMTRGELLSRISPRELAEWAIYCSLEPFGSILLDTHFAQLASLIANALLRSRNQSAHKAKQFSLFSRRPRRSRQSVEEQILFAEMFTIALGGKDLRKN